EFWIMHQGLKAGPFSYKEIDKKLEMDLLTMTDLISIDEGENWLKIYQIHQFDRRSHQPNNLPVSPREENFTEVHLKVIEEFENKGTSLSDEMAELAYGATHSAKVIPFKSEDVIYKAPAQHQPSRKKWVLPTAIALAGTLFLAQEFFFASEPTAEVAEVSVPSFKRKPAVARRTPPAPTPKYTPPQYERSPASIRPAAPSI